MKKYAFPNKNELSTADKAKHWFFISRLSMVDLPEIIPHAFIVFQTSISLVARTRCGSAFQNALCTAWTENICDSMMLTVESEKPGPTTLFKQNSQMPHKEQAH